MTIGSLELNFCVTNPIVTIHCIINISNSTVTTQSKHIKLMVIYYIQYKFVYI